MRAKFAVKKSWKIEKKNNASFMDVPDRAYSMYAVCNSYIMWANPFKSVASLFVPAKCDLWIFWHDIEMNQI